MCKIYLKIVYVGHSVHWDILRRINKLKIHKKQREQNQPLSVCQSFWTQTSVWGWFWEEKGKYFFLLKHLLFGVFLFPVSPLRQISLRTSFPVEKLVPVIFGNWIVKYFSTFPIFLFFIFCLERINSSFPSLGDAQIHLCRQSKQLLILSCQDLSRIVCHLCCKEKRLAADRRNRLSLQQTVQQSGTSLRVWGAWRSRN